MLYSHLWITLPDFITTARENDVIWSWLFDMLWDLDTKAQSSQSDSMRLDMIQNAVKQWIAEIKYWIYKNQNLTDKIINLAIISKIELVMAMEMWDEWWKDESDWFDDAENTKDYIDYKPLNISEGFWLLRRHELQFFEPNKHMKTIGHQPFIERSDEQASIEFAKEYYKYCCDPTRYPWTSIKFEDIWGKEWFPLTKWVIKYIEKKIWKDFLELKISKFFDENEFHYAPKELFMPSHGLLCHMFLMCSLAEPPFYLTWLHLWDPDKYDHQFEYYSQFLIHNDEHVIPNRQWFIKLLKILITLLKNKKEHGSRLCQQEISIDELFPLMKEQNIWPFELYANLIREQFRLVDNITTWDTIWFTLTGTGMMFLYMCCPNI